MKQKSNFNGTEKISGIVFSNNSPKKLELFLQSVKKNNIDIFEFHILYNSDENNDDEYLKVFGHNKIRQFLKINNFKEDLLSVIDMDNNKLVSFFKDTNYFFSELPSDNIEEIMNDDEIFCFSLNLGKNVVFDYYNEVKNVLLNEKKIHENCIKWNSDKHYLSFGRSLELSGGYIYRKKDIYKMFKKWKYDNINELEESFDLLEYFPREEMVCFLHNVCVDIVSEDDNLMLQKKLVSYDWSIIDRQVIKI